MARVGLGPRVGCHLSVAPRPGGIDWSRRVRSRAAIFDPRVGGRVRRAGIGYGRARVFPRARADE